MTIELYALGAGAVAVAFALYLAWTVGKLSQGEGKMVEIAEAIRVVRQRQIRVDLAILRLLRIR